jgi:hypothetical protein
MPSVPITHNQRPVVSAEETARFTVVEVPFLVC